MNNWSRTISLLTLVVLPACSSESAGPAGTITSDGGAPEDGALPSREAGGRPEAGRPDTGPPPSEAGASDVLPLNLAFTFHLEGTSLVASKDAFDRYVTNIRATSKLFRDNGAIPTWDSAEIVGKSKTYGVNILKELEDSGDAIGLHANGVGYSPTDPNYTLQKMTTDLKKQRDEILSLGVNVRHVSNICSAVDWVKATRDVGFESATAMVEYCLKSLTNPGTAASCPSPADCHDPYPSAVEDQITAWYAEGGTNWTTPASSGLLLVPSAGAVPCAAESAAGTVSPTKCAYGSDDVTAVLAEIDRALAARKAGKVHSYVMVASFGQTPDATVMQSLLSQIKAKYVDTGKAKWVKYQDLIDLNRP